MDSNGSSRIILLEINRGKIRSCKLYILAAAGRRVQKRRVVGVGDGGWREDREEGQDKSIPGFWKHPQERQKRGKVKSS